MNVVSEVRHIISSIDLSYSVKSVSDNQNGTYTVKTCGSNPISKCFNVTINGSQFNYVSRSGDEVVLSGSETIIEDDIIELSPLTFLHGTYISANNELTMMDQNSIKSMPLAFMISSPLKESVNIVEEEMLDREVELSIYFLTDTNIHEWCANDHHEEAIYPMKVIAEKFVDECLRSKSIGYPEDYSFFSENEIYNVMNFGINQDKKGNVSQIFNKTLSGVLLKTRVPFLKKHNCSC